MNVLSLPVEVIEGHLLPFLKWNDLLRFRRVCQLTKAITADYLKIHPELAPEIEIDEEVRNIGAFLKMNIPTTKVFLNNVSEREFYESNEQDIDRLLEELGPVIKSLRVAQLSVHIYGKELKFLNALFNLKHLEVGQFGYDRTSEGTPEEAEKFIAYFMRLVKTEASSDYVPLRSGIQLAPRIVTQLKTLRIGQPENVWDPMRKHIDYMAMMYTSSASELEHVSVPFTLHDQVMDPTAPERLRHPKFSMYHAMRFFSNQIKARAAAEKPNLKFLDFINFHEAEVAEDVHWMASVAFLVLCGVSASKGVKLLNVSSRWCSFRETVEEYNAPTLGIPIVSLVDLHPWMIKMDLPNLEKVEIRATSQSSVGFHGQQQRQQWPALKCLDISVDSKESEYVVVGNGNGGDLLYALYKVPVVTKSLFEFFFRDIVRSGLTELRLNFTKDDTSVAIPNTKDIAAACPNLKKLTIVNWPDTNKALAKLWEGLSLLEEVSLENCGHLGNVAFVGGDREKPIFLKLSKLRKLSLKGLDKMPKITDTLFKLVVRHLKLSHLTLTSDVPIKSVTLSGIQSLLEGDFAESIEKLEFQGLSLERVSTEEFNELGKKFRFYDML